MEAIKKQASKLREQVARQQQAVLRRLGTVNSDTASINGETDILYDQQIQDLYNSTRTAKHFQRNIVRGVEGFISVSSKQTDIVRKLAQDCVKYGEANRTVHPVLAGASSYFGSSFISIEKEKEILLKTLSDQVCDSLRAQINGAPLEDARHLTRRYERLRQDVEAQVGEVLRRRSKTMGPSASEETSIKLENAEARLRELKSSIVALGREASGAMLSVEEQQQKMTFQSLLTMVDAERSYHQHALTILENLHTEMTTEKQPEDYSSSPSTKIQKDVSAWLEQQNNNLCNANEDHDNHDDAFFIAKVIHQFDAQADGELSLLLDDLVVVRQVAPNGWSEGESDGKVGWFPSAYVQPTVKESPRNP